MAAEASKLLKGVDAVALHLAKTALTRDTSVYEAPNVGKSYTDSRTVRIILDIYTNLIRNSSGGDR